MEVLEKIADNVIDGDQQNISKSINEALQQNIKPEDIIEKGMRRGIEIVGDKFAKLELFLPEMIRSAATMKAGIDILKPHIKAMKEAALLERMGSVVIGTVQGDLHTIGKDLVTTFLKLVGFEVYDLGVDVPAQVFVEKAEEKQADIIGISALLTSTMDQMRDIIAELETQELRQKYAVMIGGGPVTQDFADEIGADGFGEDFSTAAQVAKELVSLRRR